MDDEHTIIIGERKLRWDYHYGKPSEEFFEIKSYLENYVKNLQSRVQALEKKLDITAEKLTKISEMVHTGACDPDDPPQDDCAVCQADIALAEIEDEDEET